MDKQTLLAEINKLIASGELVIWNPETHELLSDEDIVSACMNGDCIQISLSETIPERRAPDPPARH
jgi:hypothetical protein